MAAEALALHLEGLTGDGDAIPEPSTLEQVMADAANRGGVAAPISAPEIPVKAVRVNITLPADPVFWFTPRGARWRYEDSEPR